MSNSKPRVIPKRFEKALQDLGSDRSIVITTADKGGGVIIMDKTDYDQKMMDLLNDESSYTKKHDGFNKEEADRFNKEDRSILRRSEEGKMMLHPLEEDPQPPRMKGFPKIHKPNIPMRPITSGIGSAPHKLAKQLAKPLSKRLGSISGTHSRNSGELINRLNDVQFKDKIMVSFDVKALFTNVPIDGAMRAVQRVVDGINEEDLPLPKSDFMKLISLCTIFCPFIYNKQEYLQHNGLPMGSPLSPVLSCLFMELLEIEYFLRIMGRNVLWVRYVDDVLAVIPIKTNVENKLRLLNEVNDKIQFTIEKEEENCIPFLDVKIRRTDQGPRFSVYRKCTNKNDFIHALSGHSEQTKSGTIIGFFLRAIRICSEEYIKEEFKYIINCFEKLGYPKGVIVNLKNKAIKIMERRQEDNNPNNRKEDKYLVIPYSHEAEIIKRFVGNKNVQVICASGTKTGEIARVRDNPPRENDLSIVYSIPCNGCPKKYFGESHRGLTKRLKEHRADVRFHRVSNVMVQHIDNYNHLPKWEEANVIDKGINKVLRKSLEAMYIEINDSTNERAGFVNWSKSAAEIANKDWKSRHKGRSQPVRAQVNPT